MAGESFNTGAAANTALAEYLPRNRVLVVSDSGPLIAGSPTKASAPMPPGDGVTVAILDTEDDVLASG